MGELSKKIYYSWNIFVIHRTFLVFRDHFFQLFLVFTAYFWYSLDFNYSLSIRYSSALFLSIWYSFGGKKIGQLPPLVHTLVPRLRQRLRLRLGFGCAISLARHNGFGQTLKLWLDTMDLFRLGNSGSTQCICSDLETLTNWHTMQFVKSVKRLKISSNV